VWDAPGHAASWPFAFDFDLMDKARWLDGILEQEGITKPVIVGQSMGGYVGQAYAQTYPEAEGLCVHRLRAAATKVYDKAGALSAETNGDSLSLLSVEGPLKVRDKGRCPVGIRKEPDAGHDAGV